MHTVDNYPTPRRIPQWLYVVCTALSITPIGLAQEMRNTGRASVVDDGTTIAEPKRSFESMLLAQAKEAKRAERLPELNIPTITVREADGNNLSAVPPPPMPTSPAQPLYLDATEVDNAVPENRDWKREILPGTLLWQPPLANPLQPRFYLKGTSLSNFFTTETLDTAIGGTMPMVRWTAPEPRDLAWQMDFFALALSRWTQRDRPVGQDYRFGVLFTGASGNWSWKIGYEHTSCHVGDETIATLGTFVNRDSHIREEIVLGLAHTFWEQLRVYGVAAYAVSQAIPDERKLAKSRWNIGMEWLSATRYLRVIQPYMALDAEFRGDQDYTANTTFQGGIRIQAPSHRVAVRFGFEIYRGRSPFGQFYDIRENWTGIFAAFDY